MALLNPLCTPRWVARRVARAKHSLPVTGRHPAGGDRTSALGGPRSVVAAESIRWGRRETKNSDSPSAIWDSMELRMQSPARSVGFAPVFSPAMGATGGYSEETTCLLAGSTRESIRPRNVSPEATNIKALKLQVSETKPPMRGPRPAER